MISLTRNLSLCSFPFNNLVHHQVESIVNSCLEASNPALLDHLLKDCKLVSRILNADADPHAPDTTPTVRSAEALFSTPNFSDCAMEEHTRLWSTPALALAVHSCDVWLAEERRVLHLVPCGK